MSNNNWISVKDRLPEYGVDVLWYFGNKEYLISGIYDGCDNNHVLGGYNGDVNLVMSPATHWQYLTAPENNLENKNNSIESL